MLKQSNRFFVFDLFPSTCFTIVLAACSLPLGLFLPSGWGWENGPIENIQVLILAFGLACSLLAAYLSRDDKKIRNLWGYSVLIWLLMIGRELSWGRVFFEPVIIGPNGPGFPSIHQIWYGNFVYPLNTLAIIVLLAGVWRNFEPGNLKRSISISAIDGLVLIIAATASQLVFEKELIPELAFCSQILEEISELLVYWSLVSIVLVAGCKNRRSA